MFLLRACHRVLNMNLHVIVTCIHLYVFHAQKCAQHSFNVFIDATHTTKYQE